MSPPPERGEPVWRTVRRGAREGQQSVLPELLDLASSTDPYISWVATAAAVPAMLWLRFTAEASDRVDDAVRTWAAVVEAEQLPAGVAFASVVVAGAVYDDAPGLPRLQELASLLPAGHELRTKLESAAGFLTSGRPYFATNLGPSQPMFPFAEALWAAGVDRLGAEDAAKLWRQAASRGRREVMLALADRGILAPAEFPVLLALVQAMHEAGRPADAERVLLDARSTWWPLAAWDTLPTNLMLDPGLRPTVTDRVRESYLTGPIGYQG